MLWLPHGMAGAAAVEAVLPASSPSQPSLPVPPHAAERFRDRLDDPRQALAEARRRLLAQGPPQAGDAASFWTWLNIAELTGTMEDDAESRVAVAQAERLVARVVATDPSASRWLELRRIGATLDDTPLEEQRRRIEALRASAKAAGDDLLLCRMTYLHAFILHSADANPQAWAVADDAEKCARRFDEPRYLVWALYWRATLAARMGTALPAATFLDQALRVLETIRARDLHAEILRVAAEVAVEEGHAPQALQYLVRMRDIKREIHDDVGAGVAQTEMARVHLGQGRADLALPEATAASLQLVPPAPGYRWVIAQSLLVDAMAHLRRPELAVETARLRHADTTVLTLREKATVARSLNAGEAALGQYRAAYEDLQRYVSLREQIDVTQRAAETRTLSARYAAAAREAENRELRLRAEATRLALVARDERQKAMTISMAALVLVLLVGAALAWRIAASRRRLAELALRDDLTGTPNRRAAMRYAQQQLTLAQRLGLPLAIAVLDLDHFKKVNDTFGHAAGDEVLKAFAAVVGPALRGHDLLGRLGGEEWLLVMPGTTLAEVAQVFERIREGLAACLIAGLPTPHGIRFSMGAAMPASRDESLDRLIERADDLLYEAKRSGRDRLCTREAGSAAS